MRAGSGRRGKCPRWSTFGLPALRSMVIFYWEGRVLHALSAGCRREVPPTSRIHVAGAANGNGGRPAPLCLTEGRHTGPVGSKDSLIVAMGCDPRIGCASGKTIDRRPSLPPHRSDPLASAWGWAGRERGGTKRGAGGGRDAESGIWQPLGSAPEDSSNDPPCQRGSPRGGNWRYHRRMIWGQSPERGLCKGGRAEWPSTAAEAWRRERLPASGSWVSGDPQAGHRRDPMAHGMSLAKIDC